MTQHFAILPASELHLLDFSRLTDTDERTVRRSLDGTMAVVGWEGQTPDFITWPVLTHAETLAIMATPEWTDPDPEP